MKKMRVNFYNVEHGSCTHIITPTNKHFLVDIGSREDKSISAYIKSCYLGFGETIDWLVITHPHQDHIYDLLNMFNYNIAPRIFSRPESAFNVIPSSDNKTHVDIINKVNNMNRSYIDKIDWSSSPLNQQYNGGVDIQIFYPDEKFCTKEDLNTFSSIIILTFGSFKFVLTGDNPAAILKNMTLFKTAIRDANVLLAPHHGRDSEFCKEFVTKVKPMLTVISDGIIEILHKNIRRKIIRIIQEDV
jgi:competence protein ComEC